MTKSLSRRPRPYPSLETWRARQCLSQREAADFLGISQSVYSRLERGTRPIKGQLAKDIVQKTGVPLEIIVGAM